MGEYIEKREAIDAAKHAWAKGLEPSQYIEQIRPADVRPVVRGQWIKSHAIVGIDARTGDFNIGETDKCSECGEEFVRPIKEYKFCPYCGADMRGDQNEA